jgi:hypothetical protein
VLYCSWATFNAFLYYLYTGDLCLLPPTSNFLVAYHDSDTPEKLPPSLEWLESKSPNPHDDDYHTLHSCLPHALYRLADRYRVTSLAEKVKGYIVRSLTVENVCRPFFPFFLFSSRAS